MESILIQNKSLTAREWGFDVLVAVCAFAFCCAQAFFASSTLVVRDEMFRSMVGYVTTVPPLPVFLSLALTTLPLVLRRVSPWLVYLFTIVTFLGVQGEFRGYSMSLAGPLVALFTVGCLRPRAETAIAAAIGAGLDIAKPVCQLVAVAGQMGGNSADRKWPCFSRPFRWRARAWPCSSACRT